MSLVELLVAGVLASWAGVSLVRRGGPRRDLVALGLATLGAFGAVALAAGSRWRWQLWPLVAIGLLAAVVQLARQSPRLPDDLGRRVVSFVALGGVSLSVLLAWVLPVPSFDVASGSGPIGTTAFDLADPDRTSPSSTTRDDEPRTITVQAWWPAAGDGGDRLAVTDDPVAFADAVGGYLGLPARPLRHLDTIRSAARVDAAPADDGPLPVVVALHGWGGFRFAQAPLLEQLAADGNLVLAIDHTHGAVAAQPVAGGVVPIDPQLLPDDAPQDVYDAASTVLEDLFRGDAAALVAALRDGDQAVPSTVLDLADLDRLAVVGHSTGGGAAVWWCSEDPGCDGVLTFDPWVEPLPDEVRDEPPTVPWLSVLSGEWVGNDNDAVLRPLVAATPDADLVVIEGTTHQDVTVQPLLSPLAGLVGLAGDLDHDVVTDATVELARAFLAELYDGAGDDPLELDQLPPPVSRP